MSPWWGGKSSPAGAKPSDRSATPEEERQAVPTPASATGSDAGTAKESSATGTTRAATARSAADPEAIARRFRRAKLPAVRPQLPDEVWVVVDKAEQRLDKDLDWYKGLPPADRDQLNLVIETAVADFITWLNTNVFNAGRKTGVPSTDRIFFVAPLELTKTISLKQALDVTRLIVDILERNVGKFARRGREEATRNAMLYYAREVAFSAANVYASSAEARSDWDARIETLIIEDLADGVADHHVASRITMLGWPADFDCFAIVGALAQDGDIRAGILQRRIRGEVRSLGGDCLMSHHDNLFITLVDPRGHGAPEDYCAAVEADFSADLPLCLGPVRHGIQGAAASVRAALSTMDVAPAVNETHRPLRADDVLPERALFGDGDARDELYRSVYLSLRGEGDQENPLLATVSAFLLSGSSLETTARELNVHPNTVRYRLKRSVELTGWDPMTPREAYVLLTAIKIGRIMDARAR